MRAVKQFPPLIALAAPLMLLAAACAATAATPLAVARGSWHRALPLPGADALPADIGFGALACPSPGTCTGAGNAGTFAPTSTVFVASEVHATWTTPEKVPGLAALSKGGYSRLGSLACASAGNCILVGTAGGRAFVAAQANGTWRSARPIPGLAALSRGGSTLSTVASCSQTGWCAIAGYYALAPIAATPFAATEPFLAIEHGGRWSSAQPVPGLAALQTRGPATIAALSCADATCTAGGSYRDRQGHLRPFVASARHGAWGQALTIQGASLLAGAAPAGASEITALSCAGPGNCSAAGFYTDRAKDTRVFVVAEQNGAWTPAGPLPGPTVSSEWSAMITSMSCAAPGSCAAGGNYSWPVNAQVVGTDHQSTAFVATETNGRWSARGVPGLTTLNTARQAAVTAVSCGAPGACSAGGYYSGKGWEHAFVLDESAGVWGRAQPVRGVPASASGGSNVTGVSCASAGRCVAVGYYVALVNHGGWVSHTRIFVVSRG